MRKHSIFCMNIRLHYRRKQKGWLNEVKWCYSLIVNGLILSSKTLRFFSNFLELKKCMVHNLQAYQNQKYAQGFQ